MWSAGQASPTLCSVPSAGGGDPGGRPVLGQMTTSLVQGMLTVRLLEHAFVETLCSVQV